MVEVQGARGEGTGGTDWRRGGGERERNLVKTCIQVKSGGGGRRRWSSSRWRGRLKGLLMKVLHLSAINIRLLLGAYQIALSDMRQHIEPPIPT